MLYYVLECRAFRMDGQRSITLRGVAARRVVLVRRRIVMMKPDLIIVVTKSYRIQAGSGSILTHYGL